MSLIDCNLYEGKLEELVRSEFNSYGCNPWWRRQAEDSNEIEWCNETQACVLWAELKLFGWVGDKYRRPRAILHCGVSFWGGQSQRLRLLDNMLELWMCSWKFRRGREKWGFNLICDLLEDLNGNFWSRWRSSLIGCKLEYGEYFVKLLSNGQ